MDKQNIRSVLIAKRALLARQYIHDASEVISRTCMELIEQHHVHSIHIYNSIETWNEVDSQPLLNLLKETGEMSVDIASQHATAAMPSRQYDCIIIPVLGFDTKRNRMGMGKGWYDTFLATQPHALKIGLAFNILECQKIPIEPHDVRLDYIVTEATVY
jgi:5-formyltetrahydrofolate cyclo-ligase